MLCFVLLSFHCSPSFNFQAFFLLFLGLSTVGSSLTLSVLFFIVLLFQNSFFNHGTVFTHCKQCILCLQVNQVLNLLHFQKF